jgi:N-acetylmuramoyl-L-alanine amidase
MPDTAAWIPARPVDAAPREKDVVLEVCQALMARINQEPGMKAVLTRDGDYFISLQERTLRARRGEGGPVRVDSRRRDCQSRGLRFFGVRALRSWRDQRSGALAGRARKRGGPRRAASSSTTRIPVLQGVLLDLSQTASISASMVAADNVLKALDSIGEVRKPPRAAGGIRGAEVARYSLDAGRDRLHLES